MCLPSARTARVFLGDVRVRQALDDVEAELRFHWLRDLTRLERLGRIVERRDHLPGREDAEVAAVLLSRGSVLYFFAMSVKFAGVTCARTPARACEANPSRRRLRERPDS